MALLNALLDRKKAILDTLSSMHENVFFFFFSLSLSFFLPHHFAFSFFPHLAHSIPFFFFFFFFFFFKFRIK